MELTVVHRASESMAISFGTISGGVVSCCFSFSKYAMKYASTAIFIGHKATVTRNMRGTQHSFYEGKSVGIAGKTGGYKLGG
jgi:hypothetical protein